MSGKLERLPVFDLNDYDERDWRSYLEDTPAMDPGVYGCDALRQFQKPEHLWYVPRLIPAGGGVVLGGHPKHFKTWFAAELAISLVTDTPMLGEIDVTKGINVGLITKQESGYVIAQRLDRVAQSRGLSLHDTGRRLTIWPRSQFRIGSDAALAVLTQEIRERAIDLVILDSWFQIASGDTNAERITELQLERLDDLRRDSGREGLTIVLLHHITKGTDLRTTSITEALRGSGAMGGWYDAGLLFDRKPGSDLATIRYELREGVAKDPFSFKLKSDRAAGEGWDEDASGAVRLTMADEREVATARIEALTGDLVAPIIEHVSQNPGCSKRSVREAVEAKARAVDEALDLLVSEGRLSYRPPEKRGMAGAYSLDDEES